MINKIEFDGEVGKFDDEDIGVLRTCASFVGKKLEGSSWIETMSRREAAETEAEKAQGKSAKKKREKGSFRKASQDCDVIQDNDDEDEEDYDYVSSGSGSPGGGTRRSNKARKGPSLFNSNDLPGPDIPQ